MRLGILRRSRAFVEAASQRLRAPWHRAVLGAGIWIYMFTNPLTAQRPLTFVDSFAGSEGEEYLRYLHTTGQSGPYPVSLRGYSVKELRRIVASDDMHPWSDSSSIESRRLRALPLGLNLIYNSAFPHGINDGATWSGRGLTAELKAGGAAELGPVTVVLAPTFFRAQNGSFELAETAEAGPYANGYHPNNIDLPQRFGPDHYQGLDWGQSSLRLDLPVVSLGISSANQIWGPASHLPLVLGANAPGFPHLFVGTSAPVDLWIGRIHGRALLGTLTESEYSPEPARIDRRIEGVNLIFSPAGVTGLEVGATRVAHSYAESNSTNVTPDNQLVSVFGRWAFSRAGLEVYGEYAREDRNADLRDFLLEIDQQRAYLVGFRKVVTQQGDRLIGVTAELVNSQVSPIMQVRPQAPFYVHSGIREGHTHRGQLLGSPAVLGGGGSIVEVDYYRPNGRLSVSWYRSLGDAGRELLLDSDVQHSLSFDGLLIRASVEINFALTGTYHFNRYSAGDKFNLNSIVGARVRL